MQNLSKRARLYIWCTLVAGSGLSIYQFSQQRVQYSWPFLILCALAAVAQTLKVEGTTARSSYQISWIAYGASYVLLDLPETLLVITIAHLVDWAWHRYSWYIQSFNITSYIIIATAASIVQETISSGQTTFSPLGALGFLAATAVFTFLNHFMVGVVLWFARGEHLLRSGVFHLLPLMIDFVSLGMGVAAALLWLVNPVAVVFILAPLYLIYNTLQVPALQQQTRIEPKTGLYNSRHFAEALDAELERAHRFNRPMTVVMADIDLLRAINNTYGHLAGDVVILGIANILRQSVREYDLVARFGGEEMAILMPETSLQQALPLIEKIRATIATHRFEVSTSVEPLSASMSFGIAEREFPEQNAETIIHNADLAVYRAKAEGRNRVYYFSHDIIKGVTPELVPAVTAEQTQAVLRGGEHPLGKSLTKTNNGGFVCEKGTISKEKDASSHNKKITSNNRGETENRVNLRRKPIQQTVITTQEEPTPIGRYLNLYIISLGIITFSLFFISLSNSTKLDVSGLLLFACIILLTEWLAIDIYTHTTSISTSVAPIVAGACIFGPIGALVLALVVAIIAWLKHKSPFMRFLFNLSNHLLAGLISINFLLFWGVSILSQPGLLSIATVILATMLTYFSTSFFVACAIWLDGGQSIQETWQERFSWLWPFYIVLGIVAYALALGYTTNGVTGTLITLAPLLILRISQNQYIQKTESMVAQLRVANQDLQEHSNAIYSMNQGLILALAHVSDLRDPFVYGHAQHVARYAVLIARELNLPTSRVEQIRQAGLLHDIGKIGIPETILFKPGKLTFEEYEKMKQHAALGAALVQEIESLQHLAPFIRYHHEHYNGKGYPDGLKGEEIPLEARILGAADAIEAMASDRPYKQAFSADAIVQELQRHAEGQFDPKIVKAFITIIEREGQEIITNSARNILQTLALAQNGIPETFLMPLPSSINFESIGNTNTYNANGALTQTMIEQHNEIRIQEGRELAETLLAVASTLNTTLDQEAVLSLILEQLAQVVNYDNASIMLLDGDTLTSVARRSIHVPESRFLTVRVNVLSHVQDVIKSRQAIIIKDTHNDPRWLQRPGSETIRCWLGVPLVAQGKVIGLLNLSNITPDYYKEQHTKIATAFAAHAAAAIENARLYTHAQQELAERKVAEEALRCSQQHLQERVVELQAARAAEQKQRELAETLSEAARTLNSTLDLNEVLRITLEHLSRVIPSDCMIVKLVQDNKIELLSYRNKAGQHQEKASQDDLLQPMEALALQKTSPTIIADLQSTDTSQRQAENIRSWLGAPLTIQENVIGLIALSKEETDFYTSNDARLVAAFANQAAIAIANARLYAQVQQELNERMRAQKALDEERSLLAQRVEERTAELKAANEKLTSALRTKDEFLATISHELRTPLNAILLLTESMQNGVYGVVAQRQISVLENVQHSARHLLSLINDILDMSKIESGMFELDMGPVSVQAICRGSLQMVQAIARNKQITITQQIDPSVVHVHGDERRLAQILVNLLSNAVKFTPEGGKVGLEVQRDRGQKMIHFVVWDTGIGIAEADKKKLFQPFVQLDSKLSRQYEGTGLGLALVSRLTKLHGGYVSLESELEKGSRFTVSLPWPEQDDKPEVFLAVGIAAIDALPSTPQASSHNDQADAPLILLVEDNEIGIEAMEDYLVAHDYRVVIARNGLEAIEQTNKVKPNLILMDIQMPDMDGLEATTHIRAQNEFDHVPIIALTALAMPGDRERCMEAGANAYLSKPVSMKNLLQVIQTQLFQPQLQN